MRLAFFGVFVRFLAVLAALCSLLASDAAAAPSVTLSYNAPSTIADADEYFTLQGNPRSIDSNCDIGPDGWIHKPSSASGGVWTGVQPEATGGNFSPLPVAFPNTLVASVENCTKLGNHAPIDASRFRTASWKIKVSQATNFGFLWSHNNEPPGNGVYTYDGYFLPNAAVPTPANSWSLKHYYLPNNAPSGNPWSGLISGVTIIPSINLPAGGTTQVDWIRIIDPSTSPVVHFNWSTTGLGSESFPNVVLYVDDNSSGFDGVAVQRGMATSGNYDLTSGILEPGVYYFYAQLESGATAPVVSARSNYLGPVRVNGSPWAKFISPTRTSGAEYSRDERGDPWDMNGPGDLQNLYLPDGTPTPSNYRYFHNWNFQNGYFFAVSDPQLPSGPAIDTQVHLTVPSNRPIDTSKYRYFCVNWQIDGTNLTRSGSPALLDQAGWFSRLVWMRNGAGGVALGSTRGHFAQEASIAFPDYANGFITYCYDLWSEPNEGDSGPTWQDIGRVTTLRFDPLEATPANGFAINWAGLFAENAPNSQGNFDISVQVADPENDYVDVAFYYDSDSSGFNGTLISSLPHQVPGTVTAHWNTQGLTPGTYYVYTVLSDGLNTRRVYADLPIRVGVNTSPAHYRRAPCDFDGDGITDPTIVRSGANGAATWFSLLSSTGQAKIRGWGNTILDTFIDSDLDGDRIADEAAVRARHDSLVTFYGILSYSSSASVTTWGVRTDIPVLADIDGDSKSDPTVWRPSDGTWWSIRSQLGAIAVQWGLPGDIPTPADYDGDGWDDLAIWRPGLGFWAVLQSTRGAQRDIDNIIWKQWGLGVLGDHPMPGDYDGDGKADLVVWRPTDAAWYRCSSQNGFNCSSFSRTQFGLPGDYPIFADFDGDGIRDYAVWRPTDGTWYFRRSSNDTIGSRQWGLPGDWPLCTGNRPVMNAIGAPPA